MPDNRSLFPFTDRRLEHDLVIAPNGCVSCPRCGLVLTENEAAGRMPVTHPCAAPRYEERSREDAEMWCDRCKRRHGVVWVAPNDLWNLVMREGDRGKPDEFNFCCPICFMQLADERGVGNFMWDVRTWEPAPEATS